MDFGFSQEQVLLRESANRYVAEHCTVERHRELVTTELGFDPRRWQDFAELGWLAMPFGEAEGGLSGAAVDVMVLAEALGRGLCREPFLHTAVVCGGLLRFGAGPAQREAYLPTLMAGSSQWALAFAEVGCGYSLTRLDTVASEAGDGWRLRGHKIAVLNGHCANHLIVSARTGSDIGLFIVDTGLPGVTRQPFTAVDGSRGAVVDLDGVAVAADCLLSSPGNAVSLLEKVIDYSIVAMAGEALGATKCLLDATVEYTRNRRQFGQAIGKFQALQHRMAEMYLKVEELRSLLYNAAIQLDEGSEEAPAACAALKVKLAEAGRYVSQQAVQLHGGMGMTDELIVGHHFKRLMVLSTLFGDEDYYLARYTRLRGA